MYAQVYTSALGTCIDVWMLWQAHLSPAHSPFLHWMCIRATKVQQSHRLRHCVTAM